MSPWVSAVSDERIDPGDQSALGRARAADLLGVDVGASVADIQRAFRSAVKEAHPDGGGTDGEAFGDLHTAREILLGRGSARSASPARGRDGEGSGADGGDGESMPDEDSAPKPQSTRAGDRSARVGGEPPRRSASPSTAGHAPADGDRSALFGRGVLLMAAGLGLLIGLLVAAMVVSGNESQSVRIAPTAEAPDEWRFPTATRSASAPKPRTDAGAERLGYRAGKPASDQNRGSASWGWRSTRTSAHAPRPVSRKRSRYAGRWHLV